jgi:DNA repair protein SbcC/Rad50
MKPTKLTMTGFGPYRDTQVIDFREINNYQLFVISGKTGAGKTTMFDAICYALYGEANGEDRSDTKMLRSHFADDHTYTSVELEFEINGRNYQVSRQMPHIKKGNKTASGGHIALYETTSGTPVPCVDRFHVNDINNKLGELIGLTKDQFSQIVMLPQGEFRKLLTSDTENKEEVLRRIFKTEAFKQVRELLDGRRKKAESEVNQSRAEVHMFIQNISSFLPEREESLLSRTLSQEQYNTYQIIQALEVEIEFYSSQEKSLKEERDRWRLLLQQKETQFHHAKSINDRFQELDEKEVQVKELDQKLPEYQAKEEEWNNAEKASRLEPYEEQHLLSSRLVRDKGEQVEQCRNHAQAAKSQLMKAQVKFENEKAREDLRDRAQREVQQLEEMLPVMEQLEEKRMLLSQIGRAESQLAHNAHAVEQIWEKLKEQQKQLRKEIAELDQKTRELPALHRLLIELDEKQKAMKQYVRIAQEERACLEQEKESHVTYETALTNYEEIENKWIQGQASLLSIHLHDGVPCPVCGSKEHPEKATLREDIPTKDSLDQSKRARDNKGEAYQRAKTKLEATKEALQQCRTVLAILDVSEQDVAEQLDHLMKEKSKLEITLRELEKATETLLTFKEQLSQFDHEISKIEEKKVQLLQEHQEIKIKQASETAVYETMQQNLPDGIHSIQVLQSKLQEAKERKAQLEESWRMVQEALQLAGKREIEAKSNLRNMLKQLEDALESNGKIQERFDAELKSGGFSSVESYRTAKRSQVQREGMRKDIETFKTAMQTLRIQIQKMKMELGDKERLNLEVLLQELKELEDKNQEILKAYHSIMKSRDDASKIKENIVKSSRGLEHKEKSLRLLLDLFQVVKGDNEQRLSFERYLQIEFLELIIQAANVRLKKMTNGQFHLERSERLERQGRQSGLGLDVYDSYTGQARDVKSLSGGEKFKASLCLALGLADVIQSYEGGISIETMFIDEGFGSLDEESLSEAIDTLVELQKSGRMIGIISHVQELKAAIPAVLEVHKTREGYSRANFVIK